MLGSYIKVCRYFPVLLKVGRWRRRQQQQQQQQQQLTV